jgi:apolipoprotein N-acyltransferase
VLKLENKKIWLVNMLSALSGVLTAVSIVDTNVLLAFIGLIPLFVIINKGALANVFVVGLCFGLGLSAVLFNWMMFAAGAYSGAPLIIGLLIFIIVCAVISSLFGLLLWIHSKLSQHVLLKKYSGLILIVLFVGFIAPFNLMFSGFELIYFNFGLPLASNELLLQWVSLFGIIGLNLIVISTNWCFAKAIVQKRWRYIYQGLGILGSAFLGGYFMQQNASDMRHTQEAFSVALVSPAHDSAMRWDEITGDSLAQSLFSLNQEAISHNPKLIVWTETVIPWDVDEKDPLLTRIYTEAGLAGAETLMGAFFRENEKVFNAAIHVDAKGHFQSYFKQVLLQFLEKPVGWGKGLLLPFSNYFPELSEAKNQKMIRTSMGLCGVYLCNESLSDGANFDYEEAQFLVNIGNDAWFSDKYLADAHFLYTRIRAVEQRKDILVNLNKGYCGLIQSDGEIQLKIKNRTAQVSMVELAASTKY